MAQQSFEIEISRIPWFSKIGKPILETDMPFSKQLDCWDDWRGPLADSVIAMSERQTSLRNELFRAQREPQAEQRWIEINNKVRARAGVSIDNDVSKDVWHGQNAALSHAAYTACLVDACNRQSHRLPSELEQQWFWFRHGRWPCDWEGLFPDGGLIVF